MPSSSPAQARMMAAAAHNPGFAKKVGVPQGVAKDFNSADQGTQMLHRAAKVAALRKKPAAPKPPMHGEPDGDEGGY